jgi:tetratricopeptide (TPR) repeat protein
MMVALDKWREVGDPHYIALCMNFMVPTLNQLGRFEEAKSFMQESIALCEQSKNRWGMGTAYRYLGLACIGTGQFEEARAHLLKSLEIFRGFTEGWDIARSLTYLGDATLFAGNYLEAEMIYRDALQESMDSEAIPLALDALLGISNVQSQSGNIQNAFMLCINILDNPLSESETKSRAEQLLGHLETMLSSEQIKEARTTAQEKTFDWIVKQVLKTV